MRYLYCAAALTLSAFAIAAPAAGQQALESFYHKVHSLRADFTQTQTDEQGEVVQKASGVFLLERPDRFRWAYATPYKQIIVSNGKAFKFYDVDLSQVTVRDIGETLRATPAALLTGGASLDKAFKITDGGHAQDLDWVRMTPRSQDSDFKSIRLGLKNGVPVRMDLHDHLGQTTHIVFKDIKLNQPIAAKRFTLKLPDNVEVVDTRNTEKP